MDLLTQDVYRGLLESAPDAILVIDAEGHIKLVNKQVEAMFGYARHELLGRLIEVLVPGHVRESHPAMRRRYVAAPSTRPMGAGLTLTARRKDGSEFPVDISLSPLETDEGLLVSAAVRDVSERVTAEDARARLAAIVSSSEDAIIGKRLDGTITSWNPGAEKIYGWTAEEIVGRNVTTLLRPEDVDHEREILAAVARGGPAAVYETRRLRKDGSSVDVSVNISPIRDPMGRLVGAAGIHRDVTERKRTEETRLLLESTPDAIVVFDAHGAIRLVNARTESLFGYARSELRNQPVRMLLPEFLGADPGAADEAGSAAFAALELEGMTRAGDRFPVEVSLSPFETGEGILVSAAVRDITERKRQEREQNLLAARLQQSQRLESLGQLAGGVAHDFNNLLAVILNYAEFVAEEADDAEAVRRDVEEIRRAAERAAALTHQLLIFGRRDLVNPRVLDLNEVVRDLERMLRRTIGEHIEMKTILEPDLWPIKADPTGIEQILVNLVVNGRDAMASGGTLLVETANADVTEDFAEKAGDLAPGRYVRLTVADSGVGMSPDVAARAFEPFFSTKPKGEGTGLGLATVYGIVKQAGGDAHLYSEPGLGTTVRLYLPATEDREAVTSRPKPAAAPSGKGETVLVVEDEDQLRELTRRVLSRAGYQVLTATNGSHALDLADSHPGPIHLLLTDVVMPEMSGKALAHELVGRRPAVKVLFMSGYPQDILERGALAGGIPLVEKPFTGQMLLDRVQTMLQSSDGGEGPASR